MKPCITVYRDRSIDFIETLTIRGVTIKLYTISFHEVFTASRTLVAARKALPDWLKLMEDSDLMTHKNAFVIVHEANEGVIILFNWWTGENMIETKLFFASEDQPDKIESSLFKSKQLVCIWELEVFYHERKAWIRHILSKPMAPNYQAYQNDYYQQSI